MAAPCENWLAENALTAVAVAISEAQGWELLQQRKATERFLLRKAQAVVLLRWRGYSVMDLGVSSVALHS